VLDPSALRRVCAVFSCVVHIITMKIRYASRPCIAAVDTLEGLGVRAVVIIPRGRESRGITNPLYMECIFEAVQPWGCAA